MIEQEIMSYKKYELAFDSNYMKQQEKRCQGRSILSESKALHS